MTNEMFKKEAFKKSVKDNVKFLYRKTIEEATQEQIFQAVSYSVKDVIIDNWLATQKAYDEQDPKIVYYMSMEFLMGRALGNNLINLCAYGEVKEALEELGFDLNCIEDQEPDPALGNGGLGRLAACFLDSLATLNYAAYGCGIRYHYGMFKQKIQNGYQIEVPDNWLKNGYPFELRRPEYAKEVHFGGYVRVEYDPEKGAGVRPRRRRSGSRGSRPEQPRRHCRQGPAQAHHRGGRRRLQPHPRRSGHRGGLRTRQRPAPSGVRGERDGTDRKLLRRPHQARPRHVPEPSGR